MFTYFKPNVNMIKVNIKISIKNVEFKKFFKIKDNSRTN